jgi:methyl-accepting chemotaxis protein
VVGIARIMKKSELELKLAGMQMVIIKSNISKMMSNLKELVDVVNNTDIGDIDALDGNLQKIESTLVKISTRFNNLLGGENDALLSEVIKKEATYAKVVADTDKLINRINGMDIAKVSALAKMFGNAAAFSNSINGNFDKLADVINEKIAPLIEGLTHAINEADKHIQESAKKAEEARQAAENAQRAAREARDTATANNPLSSIGSTLTNAIGKVAGDKKPGTTPGTTPTPKPNEKPAPKARKDETIGDYINRVGYLPVRIK